MQDDKILEFCDVTLASHSNKMSGVTGVTFTVSRGELLMILVEGESENIPLADIAEGLIEPDSGYVTFAGERWAEMLPARQSDMRGKIGRVFEKDGWISNLNVSENIMLSERHHTSRQEAEIQSEAESLSLFVGLPSLPDVRPDTLPQAVLRRAEWVRAFMGDHTLIILEQPENKAPIDSIPKLVNLVGSTLSKGNAVIWMTRDPHLWVSEVAGQGKRCTIKDGKLM